ncbi:MAG TPA: hypothetical protein VFJ02_10440 [Vicinamibacterales bacterium]|nr:hypothetical protein [Vicinamibacterales bacterium]
MWTWRSWARRALGIIVILHALAHAVLPMRGLLEFPPATFSSAIGVAAYGVAIVTLFTAGVGMLWSRVFARFVPRLMGVGLLASVVALIWCWDASAWWGLSFDVALIGAFRAAVNTGVLTVPEPIAASTARRAGRWLAEAVACALVVYVAGSAIAWPWYRRWGATVDEQRREWPGGGPIHHPQYQLTHAVTIDAPPDVVWSWLVQLGQDRAGFYSYDWLERAFFADIHNASEIRPEWQHRQVGDFIPAAQPYYLGGVFGRNVGWTVTQVEPGRLMVLDRWGAFVLEPVGSDRTRFIVRSSIGGPETPAWGAGVSLALFELPHFIMERKMMLTIKAHAERSALIARVER